METEEHETNCEALLSWELCVAARVTSPESWPLGIHIFSLQAPSQAPPAEMPWGAPPSPEAAVLTLSLRQNHLGGLSGPSLASPPPSSRSVGRRGA